MRFLCCQARKPLARLRALFYSAVLKNPLGLFSTVLIVNSIYQFWAARKRLLQNAAVPVRIFL